MSHGT